jgi:dTDP-4-dehydrorhamnose reductase
MKILVIGKNGQLVQELLLLSTPNVEIMCIGREQINVLDKSSLLKTITENDVDAAINACAYNDVNNAETEDNQAYKINTLAVKNLANVCKTLSLHLMQRSTDFVFKSSPYLLLKAEKIVWLDKPLTKNGQPKSHRFHHVSTDEVYCTLSATDPAYTEEKAYTPNSPYSASKAASDHLVRAYYHTYG